MRTNVKIDTILQVLKDHMNLNMTWKSLPGKKNDPASLIALKIGNNQVKVPVVLKQELRKVHLTELLDLRSVNRDYLFLAQIISQPLRQKLRVTGINFIDGNGNASINIENIHIQVDGINRRNTPGSIRIFRAAHLKLIWHLLQKPEYLNKPYREIAQLSGVSLDTISKTLKALENHNFCLPVNNKNYRLINKNQLLEKWLVGFEDTLKPKLYRGTYRFADKQMPEKWQNIKFNPNKILWSGEPAASKLTRYLLPELFTIYTSLNNAELLRDYRIVPDVSGNVKVNDIFFNPEIFHVDDCVPPLLIYADLQISGDERNRETAKMIYEGHIANIIR